MFKLSGSNSHSTESVIFVYKWYTAPFLYENEHCSTILLMHNHEFSCWWHFCSQFFSNPCTMYPKFVIVPQMLGRHFRASIFSKIISHHAGFVLIKLLTKLLTKLFHPTWIRTCCLAHCEKVSGVRIGWVLIDNAEQASSWRKNCTCISPYNFCQQLPPNYKQCS